MPCCMKLFTPSNDLTLFLLHILTAKVKYGTILANVDYLHGSAESLLTITNLLIGKRPPGIIWMQMRNFVN